MMIEIRCGNCGELANLMNYENCGELNITISPCKQCCTSSKKDEEKIIMLEKSIRDLFKRLEDKNVFLNCLREGLNILDGEC
jgi:hypothetical protein